MANKRKLKKAIRFITGDLLTECACLLHFESAQTADVDNIMLAVLHMHDDLLARCSHPEPGLRPRDYFKRLKDDLRSTTEEIIEQIENANV